MNRRGSTARSAILLTSSVTFARLERELGGRSGAVFSAGGVVTSAGTLTSAAAWSTIKVPLAIAALAEGRETLVEKAISESDNDSARALCESLGPPDVAAAAVESVLAAAGDTETKVETELVHPPYTSFGQTEWTLAAQQRFAAGLVRVPRAEPVLELMRRVIPEQRWGLGALDPRAAIKGGWGPDPPEPALVRQFGIITVPGRTITAAIANQPEDGSYETGASNLTRIAEWVRRESVAGR
jgi:hypothetical protein